MRKLMLQCNKCFKKIYIDVDAGTYNKTNFNKFHNGKNYGTSIIGCNCYSTVSVYRFNRKTGEYDTVIKVNNRTVPYVFTCQRCGKKIAVKTNNIRTVTTAVIGCNCTGNVNYTKIYPKYRGMLCNMQGGK